MDKYGRAIRDIREKNNDTREELAKKLKISEHTLGKYERGERNVKPEFLEKVAVLYDIPVSYFFEKDFSKTFTEAEEEFIQEKDRSMESLKGKYILESVDGKPLTEDELKELEIYLKLYRIRKDMESS